MAKAKPRAEAADADAAITTYAVLTPLKLGGKRVLVGTIDLDPEAEDTQELLAFGAIAEAQDAPDAPEGETKPQE